MTLVHSGETCPVHVIDDLLDQGVYPHPLYVDGVFLLGIGEQLGENHQGWVDQPCLSDEILAHMEGSVVAVVYPKAIEVLGH